MLNYNRTYDTTFISVTDELSASFWFKMSTLADKKKTLLFRIGAPSASSKSNDRRYT